jgi:hypothetical protein
MAVKHVFMDGNIPVAAQAVQGQATPASVSVRCPYCLNMGTFAGTSINDIAFIARIFTPPSSKTYTAGVRLCPNDACRGILFVIMEGARLVTSIPRGTFCCRTIAPRLSSPTKWNVFLPRSIPIVVMVSGLF